MLIIADTYLDLDLDKHTHKERIVEGIMIIIIVRMSALFEMAPYDLRKLEEVVTSDNKALAINPDLPDTEKAQYFALQQIEELK